MVEKAPHMTQWIGQADANAIRPEVPSAEFMPTSEQQQIGDVMRASGIEYNKAMVEASNNAKKQLTELHGKELVKAGFKKIGLGLGIGWAAETGSKAIAHRAGEKMADKFGPMADKAVPEFLSEISETLSEETVQQMSTMMADVMMKLQEEGIQNFSGVFLRANDAMAPGVGNFAGLEMTGPIYGLLTRKANLPKMRWYEWAIGQVGVLMPRWATVKIKGFELNTINPVTVSGLFNVIKGFSQMAMAPKQTV